jgi:hypothetical protein
VRQSSQEEEEEEEAYPKGLPVQPALIDNISAVLQA